MADRNTLYYGDNLDILRHHIPTESVDLVYLDPPFNSNRAYNVLFKEKSGEASPAQIEAFTDAWQWDRAAERAYDDLITEAPAPVAEMVGALRLFVGANDMMAYLVMMAARLVELHRVLRPTGSLYLHCDPTASHYLKIILDAIFGKDRFRNEIIWRRSRAHNDRTLRKYGAIHDTILFYTKGKEWTFNKIFSARDKQAPKTHDLYRHTDGELYRKDNCLAPGGRGPRYEWNGHVANWRFTQEVAKELEAEGRIVYSKNGMPRVLRPVDLERGAQLQDIWTDIDAPNSGAAELLGYPTQKPLALLERIISSSSNTGETILDPFCECGTAVVAAQKLGRRWIGIDITHLAIALMRYRLQDAFPDAEFDVKGEPADVGSARMLAESDRYQFQWWALSLVKAKPIEGKEKKGADRGIDGVINFVDDTSGKLKRCLVQVKSGNVSSATIRDLVGTLDREKAEMGLLVTLEPATGPMVREAVEAGWYRSNGWRRDYPRVQILTIQELLDGKTPESPPMRQTFARAERIATQEVQQQVMAGFVEG